MENFKTVLTGKKVSQAGNTYFVTHFKGHDIAITVNNKYKEETKKTVASFLMQVSADTGKEQYSGRGALWCMIRKEGKVHQGTLLFNDDMYNADIRRIPGTEDFEFQLTSKKPIALESL